MRGHLAHDQRLAIGSDHHAIGKAEARRCNRDCAVRLHQHEIGLGVIRQHRTHAPHAQFMVQIEAKVADVGAALAIDHHVVAQMRGVVRQIGMQRQPSIRPAPPHLPLAHGDEQQRTIGHPPQPRRLVIEFQFDPVIARHVHRTDGVAVEVAEPQPATRGIGMPARPLAEVKPIGKLADRAAHALIPPAD